MAMWRWLSFSVLSVLAVLAYSDPALSFETVRFQASEKYNGRTVTLRGELFRPSGTGPFPAVILMHGCGGWQSSVHKALRTHARYLAQNGFVALNLDSFGPRRNSGGWVCRTSDRLSDARAYRQVDALDAVDFLRARDDVDPDNMFLMGQSNGGSVAVIMAHKNVRVLHGERAVRDGVPTFRAMAAYYPWCGTLTAAISKLELISPLYVFGGDRDDWTPPAGCASDTVRGAEYRYKIYPGAAHSFDLNIGLQRYLGHLVGYNRTATRDSRVRMVEFFRSHFTEELQLRAPLTVLQAQTILKAQGLDPGPLDGAWGRKTLAALNALREQHNLEPVDALDATSEELLKSLQ